MKHLIRIAIGVAIAAALVNLLAQRRSRGGLERQDVDPDAAANDVVGRGTAAGFTVEELIADTPAGRTLNS